MNQLPKLLRSLGAKFDGKEIDAADKRAVVLKFVESASPPGVKIIELNGQIQGSEFRGLLVISE